MNAQSFYCLLFCLLVWPDYHHLIYPGIKSVRQSSPALSSFGIMTFWLFQRNWCLCGCKGFPVNCICWELIPFRGSWNYGRQWYLSYNRYLSSVCLHNYLRILLSTCVCTCGDVSSTCSPALALCQYFQVESRLLSQGVSSPCSLFFLYPSPSTFSNLFSLLFFPLSLETGLYLL